MHRGGTTDHSTLSSNIIKTGTKSAHMIGHIWRKNTRCTEVNLRCNRMLLEVEVKIVDEVCFTNFIKVKSRLIAGEEILNDPQIDEYLMKIYKT
jgi:hypothetical protein